MHDEIHDGGSDRHRAVRRFTELRVRNAFEKSQHTSYTYSDWFLDRPFVLVPIQALAGRFLQTMVEFPPSQSPGSFNLASIQKQIEAGAK